MSTPESDNRNENKFDTKNLFGNNLENKISQLPKGEQASAKKAYVKGVNIEKFTSNPKFKTFRDQHPGKPIEETIFDFLVQKPENVSSAEQKIVRKNHQNIQYGLNTGKTIEEITAIENRQYVDSKINTLNITEQQKNKLNLIGGANKSIIIDLLGKEDDRNIGLILLDTLAFIKEYKGDVFRGSISLTNEGFNAIKSLYPDINPEQVTLKRLNENLLKDNDEIGKIIKPTIENALNERFLSTLDESLRSSSNVEDSNKAIKDIIEKPEKRYSLKLFIDYYNYKNPGKELGIDPDNIQPKDKEKLEKAIKEELHINAFTTDLTEEEKRELDKQINNRISHSRENLRSFRERRERMGRRPIYKEESSNINENPGWLIASKLKLGNGLLEKYGSKAKNIDINNPRVFHYARRKFCKDYKNLGLGRLSPKFIKDLYQETNNFNNFDGNGENLKKFKSLFGDHNLQLENTCSILKLRFYNYLNDAHKMVSNFQSKINEKSNEGKNNRAIGTVIDGIRNIFTDLGEKNNIDGKIYNFELDKKTPVELENNNEGLIIKGTFKGNPVKIKYNLITGEVYMNTCINKTFPSNTIIFGKEEPNFYIGQISDFASILEDFKDDSNKPQNAGEPDKQRMKDRIEERKRNINESFEKGIDKIKNIIGEQLETNQAKNEASTNLLRTLGIIDEKQNNNINKEVQFEEGSDAYKVMQIINNSKKEDIRIFSENMKTLAEFAGRSRGNNKPLENPTIYKNFTEDIATYMHDNMNDKEKYIKYADITYFLEKIKNLNNKDFDKYTGKTEIPKEYTNPFISIVYEKFASEENPDWKLDQDKIVNFITELIVDKNLILSFVNKGIQ